MQIELITIIEPILKKAGDKIIEIYNSDEFNVVDFKDDDSPLTLADIASNNEIVKGLKDNFDFPIISEELENAAYESRKDFKTFWCVDPLDGTKEFINRNGEFTVNIALIVNGSVSYTHLTLPTKA